MLDIHCHILSGIDDGADTTEKSLKMLEIAQKDGTTKIIATPHYIRGYNENSFDDIEKRVGRLNALSVAKSIGVKVYTGQEVYLDDKTVTLYKNGIIRGLNYTKYILVEFPMISYDESMIDILYELRLRGAIPIIAHPERYTYFINKPSLINQFVKEGYLFQINTGSINGIFGNNVKDTSNVFIKNNICDFIASDAHTTDKRCPGLSAALTSIESINYNISKKIKTNMIKLYNNNFIEPSGQIIRKKRMFKWF